MGMESIAYVGEVIAACVYLFVGVRLYRLSRRTGHLPEKLIAATFLIWTLGYALYDIPYAFVEADELITPAFAYSSQVAFGAGNFVFALFIRAVFRSGARWATALVAAIGVCFLLGLAGTAWIGDWEGVELIAGPWYWLDFFGTYASTVWMPIEGFVHYYKARRRMNLGLCEPMICNRFLLWGIAGALWMILEMNIVASDLVFASTGEWSALLGLGNALLEIAPIAIVWLVFFPPASYCRWVERAGRPTPA